MSKLPLPLKLIIGGIGYNSFRLYMNITKSHPNVVNEEDTVRYILNNRCSVARFGDGELLWIFQDRQKDNFEINSQRLAYKLNEVLNSSSDNLIICIPNVFNNFNNIDNNVKTYWEWLLTRKGVRVLKLLNSSKKYYSAQITRPYMDYKKDKVNFKKRFNSIKKIWKDRNLLIVEGEKTRFGVSNDLLDNAKSVQRVICPSTNAFEKYDAIFNKVKTKAALVDDVLVLAALGPSATVLAFELSNIGVQTIDIGHLDIEYQWFKMNAKKKVPITGKYVNELNVKFAKELAPKYLKKYKDEIIYII